MQTTQQEEKKALGPGRRAANRFTDRELAVIMRAAAELGIVGVHPVARYIRRAVFEQLRRDGFEVAEASK